MPQDPMHSTSPNIAMKASCVLMTVGNQTMLRSLKTLLEPYIEVSAMTDNILSLIDAVEVLVPDLVIIHSAYPDHDHMNMTRHLKSRCKEMKIIVVSDITNSTIVCDMLNQGVNGFVFQHKAKTELVPAVREVLKGNTYVSSIERPEGGHRAKS